MGWNGVGWMDEMEWDGDMDEMEYRIPILNNTDTTVIPIRITALAREN